MTNATNANIMKERNKRLILNLIREKNLSKAEISRETSLTKPAVSVIVNDLIEENSVIKSDSVETTVGRYPVRLKLNSDFMYAIGINITRNFAEFGIVNINGDVLFEERVNVFPKKTLLKSIILRINDFIKENNIDDNKIHGIGITAPGPLDSENTTVLNPTNFDEWHYENIGQHLKDIIDKPVYLENISTGLTICEKYYGVAKKWNDFLLLRVSDGIGSGIMTNGKLFKNLCELGHTSINFEGIPCECGNLGCVEKYASVPSILKDTEYNSWEEVVDNNDTSLIYKEARYLSCALVNAINIFGLSNIILNGEITYKSENLISHLQKFLNKNAFSNQLFNIVKDSSFSGVLYSAVSVFNHYFNEFQ